jgi:polar amino acid transport system substrate-binding protein
VRRLIALSVAVLAAAALTACDGSSSSDDTPSTSATPAPTTPPTAECADPYKPVQSFQPSGSRPTPGAMPDGSYMKQIQDRGKLRAGVSADTLLFGFRNPQTGQLEGFDIDVVKAVALAIFGDLNDRIEYTAMPYSGRIPALKDDKVDIVADVMTINCARWKQISFSSQYFDAGQKVMVRSDSKAKGIEDLNGQKVCVAATSTNETELAEHYPEVDAVPVGDVSDCMVLFQQGKVDAVTGDDTVLLGFVTQDPYAKVVGDAITSEPYGLGIKKGRPEFVQFVNGVLEDVRADGRWKQWYQRWLDGNAEPPTAQYGRPPS